MISVMSKIKESISSAVVTRIEAPLRKKMMTKIFDALGVRTELHVDPKHQAIIEESIEKIAKNEKQIIFVGLEHLDHLDSFIQFHLILSHFPQLLPHLTVVAASEVWGDPKMKLIANFFLRSVTLFDRSGVELKKQIRKLKQLPIDRHKSALILFAQPGRGKPITKLPITLAHEYGDALVVLCKISNQTPTFGKEERVPTEDKKIHQSEAEIIRHQVSEALHRQKHHQYSSLSLEIIDIISTHDNQDQPRSIRELTHQFLSLTTQLYPDLVNQKEAVPVKLLPVRSETKEGKFPDTMAK
jgi:hypothetical protein